MAIPIIVYSALTYGALITIMSLGFTLTYMTAKIPNFAHGTYAGFGIYVSFTLAKLYGYNPYWSIPISIMLGAFIGMILYMFVIRTMIKLFAGEIVLTISTIAIGLFMKATIDVYTFWVREKWGQYTYGFLLKQFDFKFFSIPGIFFVSNIVCLIVVLSLFYTLKRTKIGVAMRAATEDLNLASIVGINTHLVQTISWCLTGALACLAGSMIPFWFQSNPAAGDRLLMATMAGSLLGGLDNIYGAVIGGFFVGCVEILFTSILMSWFGSWVGEYRPLVPLAIVILVLLIKPKGLSGAIEEWRSLRR